MALGNEKFAVEEFVVDGVAYEEFVGGDLVGEKVVNDEFAVDGIRVR